MAAQTSYVLEEEELSCPICFEEFNLNEKNRHPKLLLCLHTFCLACMETLRKYDGSLQCSICRTSHQVYRVCDLMDNYVIFEHLKFKQEYEDEKLAAQLKEEYEDSMRAIKEQEERDAQLAKEEDEKLREEVEKLRREEEKRKQEYEKQELERLERLRVEAQREVERQQMEEREILEQIRRQKEEEEKQRIEQENIEAAYLQIRVNEVDLSEDRESSSDSSETRSDDSSDSDTDDDESFQDLESRQTDEDSPTSVVDEYETLSSDTDHYSTEVVSSDENEDREEGIEPAVSSTKTAPSQARSRSASPELSRPASPEPDLFSEEFSGVALTNKGTKPQENLSKLLPSSVKCKELQDGTILILDSSTEEPPPSEDETTPKSSQGFRNTVNSLAYRSSSQTGDSDSEPESKNLSSEEDCVATRARNNMNAKKALHLEHDENCKLQ